MYCQTCGALNPDDGSEFCGRCQSKLLVVSGPRPEDEQIDTPEEVPLDEHLLERISALEEVVQREGEMIRTLFDSFQRLEKSLSIVQTGVLALQETLEQHGVLSPGETEDRWQARSEERLHAVEKKERFIERQDRIVAGFSGTDRGVFLQKLHEAEVSLLAIDSERGTRFLEEAFRMDRGNAELGFFLAESYFSEGDLERAAQYLKKILAARPQHYEALLYSGIVASESGDAKNAEVYLKRAIEIRSEGFLAHFALGGLYARQGKFDVARGELVLARDIVPIAAARVLLGQVERELGQVDRAIEEFEEALKEDPSSQEAYFQLGMAYLEKNRPRRAQEAFQRALEINPKRLEVQEAVRLLDARKLSGSVTAAGPAQDDFRRAEECVAAGKFRRALEFYLRALEHEPENDAIRISYALLCASLGHGREAAVACRRVLSGKPEEMVAAAACSILAEVLRSEGQLDEAAHAVEDFLAHYDSATARTIGYYELASSLVESEEKLNSALDFASRSLESAPDELKPFSLAALGWVYYKKKDFESAIDFLKRSSEGSANPATLHRLGMAYLAAGRAEEAKFAFKRAKTVASRGARLEERILDQVRSNLRMVEMASARRKA
jgi:tetratricopeptide (TPR) repeat protein